MNKLENILDESLLHSASGDRKALRLLLKKVIPDRFHYYHESRDITRQEEYADLLYKILLLELDEEEEESIELAELVSPGTHLRVPQKAYYPNALFRGLFHG